MAGRGTRRFKNQARVINDRLINGNQARVINKDHSIVLKNSQWKNREKQEKTGKSAEKYS